jgi:hemolysin III
MSSTPLATPAPPESPPEVRPSLRGRLHAVAAALLLASSPLLWWAAEGAGVRLAVVAFLVGVGTMLTVSAVYHVPEWGPVAKRRLRHADHSAIFLAIAGTYTPLLAVVTDGWFRTGMLIAVWTGAAAGIAISNLLINAPKWVVATPYVVLGWASVLLLPALLRASPLVAGLVLAGGVAYTVGAVVYARKRPDPWPRVFGFHELFHALTIAAVIAHWMSVWVALQG